MITPVLMRHELPGLRSEPLARYLAGLGLIKVLGRHRGSDVTVAWTADGLVVRTTVPDLADWLANEYVPTPVLSPWNNGSGFGAKDKESRRVLNELRTHPSPRLAQFREAIRLGEEAVLQTAGRGDKRRVVLTFRNCCPDSLLGWIDAAVVLAGDDTFFPPLLGTGGNDGRLDFSTNFHQRLLEVIGSTEQERVKSAVLARDLLDGTEVEQLAYGAVGQFDPGSAGGPGSSRFGAARSLVNPWAYVLLVEGAMLFAASAVRRTQHYRVGDQRAAIPFTVTASPDGSTSGAAGEEARGEVWSPVWTQEFSLAEIEQLFSEARASWRGRPARRAVDFYAATRTLGVARGVTSFTRYGLQRRNGLAFAAVPLDRVSVRAKPEVRLAAGLDDWVQLVSRGDTSTAVAEALRGFEKAHLAFARDGGALPLIRLLGALTTLEQTVGRSGRAKENLPVRRLPSADEFLQFLEREAPCPELRIAAGLASCSTVGGTDPARSMRKLLLPIDPAVPGDKSRAGSWRHAPLVPGFGLRPLHRVLADVLVWRSRTAANEPTAVDEPDQKLTFRGIPTFRSGIRVPAADLHKFALGEVDSRLVEPWLLACLALDWRGVHRCWGSTGPVIPQATLGLLHPLAQGLGSRRGAGNDEPKLALRPDWAVRLAAGQVRQVHDEVVARMRQVGWDAARFPQGATTADAHLIAGALVPRCLGWLEVLNKITNPEEGS